MSSLLQSVRTRLDVRAHQTDLAGWLARAGMQTLRIGLGIVFLWAGALKLVPGTSPAEQLIARAVSWVVDPAWFVPALAAWECLIGIGLLWGRYPTLTLLMLFAHMPGTFMPLFTCPELVWSSFPFVWTLEGQYILKNIVLIGAGLTLSACVAERRNRPRGSRRKAPSKFCP